MKKTIWITVALAAFILPGCDKEESDANFTNPADSPYAVTIDPADFLPGDSITGNTYFPLIVGQTMIYEGFDDGESETVEVIVMDSIKTIMGVDCRIVRDKAFENDELVEDTFDWYAQDRSGNVWYFGEDTHEIENNVPVNSDGSWEAGVDGALPGILMFAEPIVGVWYRQEYYKGEAEDVAQVLSIGETLTVPYGTFTNCLRTLEYPLLEPGNEENKIYAPGIGLLRAVATKGGSGFEELVSITP
ncbi:hypothetical protein JNM05_12790 [bacterium]|nr:hypothetical protein [bacterium]